MVGKELEIRRWLSKSHLYSSVFVVDVERDGVGTPVKFVLHGGGWGHGVGLCQVGAYGMAGAGAKYQDILKKYYSGVNIDKIY